jgi:hypothetical protein
MNRSDAPPPVYRFADVDLVALRSDRVGDVARGLFGGGMSPSRKTLHAEREHS